MISPPPAARDKTVITEVLLLPQSHGKSELSLRPLCLWVNERDPPGRPQGCHAPLTKLWISPCQCQPGPGLSARAPVSGAERHSKLPTQLAHRLAPLPTLLEVASPQCPAPKKHLLPFSASPLDTVVRLPCAQQATEPVPEAAPGWRRDRIYQQVELWLQSTRQRWWGQPFLPWGVSSN